jgi:hypothetical protein
MTHNLRVIRFKAEDSFIYCVHTVYYEGGKAVLYSETPTFIVGEDISELLFVLKNVKSALKKNIIDGENFPEEIPSN